jgi:hypothetical protein
VPPDAQLVALGSTCDLLDRQGIEYEDGTVYTPLEDGRGAWPEDASGDDVAELADVRARVISFGALRTDKSEARDDPRVAAKDRADLATLEAARQE